MPPTPEAQARQHIDTQLVAAGWIIQEVKAVNLSVGPGQALRDCITQHHAEIAALQILYSRPHSQRLTAPMLKGLEKKLRDTHANRQ